jgi:acyl dehydratase
VTVAAGDALPDWVVAAVAAEKMKTMAAILDDSNPIHFDVEAVRRLGMGDRVVNQGPNNMAYVMNMLSDWAGGPGHLRELTVRFQANVFAGDRLVAGGRVVEVREERGIRLAVCEVWLQVVDGPRALSGTATVMLGGPHP